MRKTHFCFWSYSIQTVSFKYPVTSVEWYAFWGEKKSNLFQSKYAYDCTIISYCFPHSSSGFKTVSREKKIRKWLFLGMQQPVWMLPDGELFSKNHLLILIASGEPYTGKGGINVCINIIQHFPLLFLQTHLYLSVHFSTIVLFTLSHLCTSISIVFLFINTFPHPYGFHTLIPEKKEEPNFLEIDLKYEDENSEVDFEEIKVLVGGRCSMSWETLGRGSPWPK